MLQNLRPLEIIAIVALVVLLFGAKKLPELAKGIGQSLRIFKREVATPSDDSLPDADESAAKAAPQRTE